MSGRLLVTWIRRWTAAQWEEPILRHKFQGHEGAIWSLVFLHDNVHIVSGSEDGTIRKWNCDTGLAVGEPWKGGGGKIYALALSPDGKTIACGREDGLHRFEHDRHRHLYSVALSPRQNVLACVGSLGVAQLWDTESNQPLGQPFDQQNYNCHYCVSFSRDGNSLAFGGSGKKLSLWTVKDIPLQLPAPALLQQSGDKQSTQQETRPNSPSSFCLNTDATGGDGLFEEAHDLCSNFFQSSQKSLPLPSSGSRIASLFSARRLLVFFSPCCPPEDKSIPKERPKRGFFSRLTCLNASLEPAPKTPNQPVPEVRVGEGERGDNRGSRNDLLDNRKDKGKERDDGSAADAQGLPSDDLNPLTELDSADNRNIWIELICRRGMSSITRASKRT